MKFAKRYRLFLILLAIQLILLFVQPELGQESLKLSAKNLKEMLSIIPPVFVLMGLMDVWIPKQTMMRAMGKGSGLKGGFFAFALGSFAAGPLYAAFPMAAVFIKKGVSLTNVFLFLGAWSTTKIPMMLFEVTQLGAKFALLRFVCNGIGIVLMAVFMDKTTTDAQKREIEELAEKQTGGAVK